MNRISWFTGMLIQLTISSYCLAQDRTVLIVGKVEPSKDLTSYRRPHPGQMLVKVYVGGSSRPNYCITPKKDSAKSICEFRVRVDGELCPRLRIEIHSPGHKKFSKNVPSVPFTGSLTKLLVKILQPSQTIQHGGV